MTKEIARSCVAVATLLLLHAGCSAHDGAVVESSLGGLTYGGSADAGSGGTTPDAGSGADAGTTVGPDASTGPGSDAGTTLGPDASTGPGSDAGTDDAEDICLLLAQGLISRSDVGQETLDECDGVSPTPPSCAFTAIPSFDPGQPGCHITEPSFGDLGNYDGACPTDPYEQQGMCDLAISSLFPIPPQIDPVPWTFTSSSPPPGEPNNEFTNPLGPDRNVVVLGSSMMSTHNQSNNGGFCNPGNALRPETTADVRGLVGSDFPRSPAWNTRVPWRRAYAGARTGFTSDNVRNATPNTPDGCNQNWQTAVPPMTAGVNWLAGKTNKLMVTDGGLINDQQSTAGGWAKTLEGIVTCNALARVVPAVNLLLDAEHRVLNPNPFGVRVNRRWVARRPPRMRLARTVRGGGWAGALDLPPNVPPGRCALVVMARGNGRIPVRTIAALTAVGKDVPPLIRLWTGGPPNSPVPGNLLAIKNAYTPVAKQIWLQYPYMDQANVTVRGADLSLLWPGGAAQKLIQAWGQNVAITIPAIDPGLAPRIHQVTDDLNKLMYDSIGCNAVAAFAPGHPARVCARNGANQPLVVITQDAFGGWGPADHQDTIIGGMPHESAGGANKLGTALRGADALP